MTNRDRLLAATVQIIANSGMQGFTYRKVSELAKVDNTLISYHFGNKDSLLIAAMEWAVLNTNPKLEVADAIFKQNNFASDFFTNVLSKRDLQVFQYQVLLASRQSPNLAKPIRKLYEQYIYHVSNVLEARGVDQHKPLARLIFAALDGLTLQAMTIASEDEIRESLHMFRTLMQSLEIFTPTSSKHEDE